MKWYYTLVLAMLAGQVCSQDHGFPFGKVTLRDLDMKVYPTDTSAPAVILNEFGEAYIDEGGEHNLIFEYHAIIKILKQEGVEQGTISIPLYRQDHHRQLLHTVKASSYTYENGSMKETPVDSKAVRTVNINSYRDEVRFAIPNVRIGSVIELSYVTESPFIENFRNWEFQSDIPKVQSEYWATVPANYIFNITLKGFLDLDKNESELIKGCFKPGGDRIADCTRFKWAMKNIPAFLTEEHMTARSNFISRINFELSEVVHFDGRRDRITREWRDAEDELRKSDRFGQQLRRGKSIVTADVEALIARETDPLTKAQNIYSFMQNWYNWDEKFGKYSEFGIRKAFETRKGNVGDINLSLVAVLRYAGLDADPLVLSTRDNGLPTEIHPVLTDFNYVIAKVTINGNDYLLDATDDFLPFGTIPGRCLNGKGRVFGEKGSYWFELKSPVKARKRSLVTMKLHPDGLISGTIESVYSGYDAIDERKELYRAGSQEAYYRKLKSRFAAMDLTGISIDNPEDHNQPLSVKLDFEFACYNNREVQNFLFSPFLFDRVTENPFRSNERLYPVDFGSPVEQTMMMTLEYPENYQLVELPAKVGISLPNATARYGFDIRNEGNKLSMQSFLIIGKPVFSSEEYHYLKELFAQMVASQQTELLFKRKL